MAIRKKLVDRVAEKIAAVPTDRFIVLDVTDGLTSASGRPLATNVAVSSIMRCSGLARNTGIIIKRGDCKFTVWEKTGASHARRHGKEDDSISGGVKA